MAEPTAEMIGEQWQSPGVPPPRDPGVPWYHRLPIDDAWRELAAPHNHNAALVTFKRAAGTSTSSGNRDPSGSRSARRDETSGP